MRSVADIFRSHGVLDEHGRHVNGTDKMTNHFYGDAYERLFQVPEMYEVDGSPLPGCRARSTRDEIKLVMEVGVADGACLLAWREVFPNARIVGMDIHPSARAQGERLEFHLGNQLCKADCERAAAGRQFDMIVEDATHVLGHTLQTLFFLWPFVRPGGLYVVEEWADIDRDRIRALWPFADIIDTDGPFGGVEPLVAFRKLLC